MTPNLQQAQAFLTALDEDSDAWTFQTFDDRPNKDRALIRQLHGSLERHQDDLATLNDRGAGVFVTINETDGKGRRMPNVKRVRALFVDLDGSPLGPIQEAANEPSITVESSPGRYHAYWRVTDCALDQFKAAQRQLITRFSADPACCDLPRVMRLPGFFHRKHAPYQVRIIDSQPREYSINEVCGADLQKRQKKQKEQMTLQSSSVSSVGRFIPDEVGQRNRKLFELARYLKGTNPDATKAELREIVMNWHRLALPYIGTTDFAESWGDFLRAWDGVRHPYGDVMRQALEGIDAEADGLSDSLARLGYGEKAIRLSRICRRLQRCAGDAPFFISARQAGELIGLHFTDASKVLYGLCADGVLQLIKLGAGKHASRYRYVYSD